jgi:hypothetical protein
VILGKVVRYAIRATRTRDDMVPGRLSERECECQHRTPFVGEVVPACEILRLAALALWALFALQFLCRACVAGALRKLGEQKVRVCPPTFLARFSPLLSSSSSFSTLLTILSRNNLILSTSSTSFSCLSLVPSPVVTHFNISFLDLSTPNPPPTPSLRHSTTCLNDKSQSKTSFAWACLRILGPKQAVEFDLFSLPTTDSLIKLVQSRPPTKTTDSSSSNQFIQAGFPIDSYSSSR